MRMLLLPAAHPTPVDEAVDIVGKEHDYQHLPYEVEE